MTSRKPVGMYRLLAALLLGTVLTPVLPVTMAVAQQAGQRNFSIAAQSLDDALTLYGQQAGLMISVDSAILQGLRSPGVTGNLAPDDALRQLLAGTGLASQKSGRTVIISRPGSGAAVADDGSIMLDTIVITGGGGTTEGAGSYTTGEASGSTGLPLSIRETPQSMSVVTDQQIKDQGLNNTKDTLQYVTGLTITTSNERVSILSRGFGVNTYIVDGVNIANAGYGDYFSNVALDSSSSIYDRVEVVRGATGLLTGVGQPGGAFRLERKQATSREVTGSANLRFGNWNRIGGGIDVSTPLDKDGTVRGRFVFDASSEDSWRDRYHADRRTWYGTIAADLTTDTTLTFSLEHKENEVKGTEYRGFPRYFSNGKPTDAPRSFSTAPDWAYIDSEQTVGSVRLDHAFENGWSANATLSATRRAYSGEMIGWGGSLDEATGLGMDGYAYHTDVTERHIGLDASASGPFELFGRSHELYFGVHGSRAWQENGGNDSSDIEIGSVYDWNGSLEYPENWSQYTSSGRYVRRTQSAAFASAKISVSDPLSLIFGGRYTNYTDTGFGGEDKKRDHKFVPYFGMVYDLNDNFSLYASYAEIFNPQGNQDRNGNYLDPVEGKSEEIGAKASFFEGRLNASLSFYRSYLDNYATRDEGYFVPGTNDQAYYGAMGNQTKGVELELAGEIRPGWNLFFGATASKFTDADGNARSGYVPTRTVKLFTTYSLPDQYSNWTVGGGLRWQNATWEDLTFNSVEERKTSSGYAVIDLMTRYDFNDTWSTQLNVNNLFDKRYHVEAGSLIGFGAPRNASLTLISRF